MLSRKEREEIEIQIYDLISKLRQDTEELKTYGPFNNIEELKKSLDNGNQESKNNE